MADVIIPREFSKSKEQIDKKYPLAGGKEGEIPFNSSYKFMTTLRKMEDGDTVIMKGAAEQVFSRCDKMIIDGNLVPIDDELQVRVST